MRYDTPSAAHFSGESRLSGTSTGIYRRPKSFGGIGKPVDETGFSDHFPIGVQVTESD